jgi:hypothetical protein
MLPASDNIPTILARPSELEICLGLDLGCGYSTTVHAVAPSMNFSQMGTETSLTDFRSPRGNYNATFAHTSWNVAGSDALNGDSEISKNRNQAWESHEMRYVDPWASDLQSHLVLEPRPLPPVSAHGFDSGNVTVAEHPFFAKINSTTFEYKRG